MREDERNLAFLTSAGDVVRGLGRPAERGIPTRCPVISLGAAKGSGQMHVPGEPHSALNQAAFAAALGLSTDWKLDLVRLLRSDEEISVAVREALADAIEDKNPTGASLTLTGHDRAARWIEGLAERREWRAFGRRVAAQMSPGESLDAQFERFAASSIRSESYHKKCYHYFRRSEAWKTAARSEGEIYGKMSDAALETEFDISSLANKANPTNPKPMSGPEFDRVFNHKMRTVTALIDRLGFSGWQREVLISWTYFSDRMPLSGE